MSIAKISMLGWVITHAREGILKEKSYQKKKKKKEEEEEEEEEYFKFYIVIGCYKWAKK